MTTVRMLITAAICITVLLTGASSALAVGEKDLSVLIAPTQSATYIFVTGTAGTGEVSADTLSSVSMSTGSADWFGNMVTSRDITLHLIVKRVKNGGVLRGKYATRERQDFDIILPDHEFSVVWNGDSSEWSRDRRKTAEILHYATNCSLDEPSVLVRKARIPDRIIIVVGHDIIWAGQWSVPLVHEPIRPGEEFPDERPVTGAPRPPWDPDSKPLPAPGEPGWDIN